MHQLNLQTTQDIPGAQLFLSVRPRQPQLLVSSVSLYELSSVWNTPTQMYRAPGHSDAPSVTDADPESVADAPTPSPCCLSESGVTAAV